MKKNNFIKMLSIFMVGISSIALTVPFVTSCSSNEKKQETIHNSKNPNRKYPWWPIDVLSPIDYVGNYLVPSIAKKFKETQPSGQISLGDNYFSPIIMSDQDIENRIKKLVVNNINDLSFYWYGDSLVDKETSMMYENILRDNPYKLSFYSSWSMRGNHKFPLYYDGFTSSTLIVKKTNEIVYSHQDDTGRPINVYEISAGSGSITFSRFYFYFYIPELANIAPITFPSNTIELSGGNVEIPIKELFPNTLKIAYGIPVEGDSISFIETIIEYYNKGWFRG